MKKGGGRRRLSKAEREIRSSRGISIFRVLPFALPVIVVLAMSMNEQLFQECIGRTLYGGGRGGAWVRLFVAIGCSPHFLFDFSRHWLAMTAFWGGVAAAAYQVPWLVQHKRYWDSVRRREAIRRAAKSENKKIPMQASSTDETQIAEN